MAKNKMTAQYIETLKDPKLPSARTLSQSEIEALVQKISEDSIVFDIFRRGINGDREASFAGEVGAHTNHVVALQDMEIAIKVAVKMVERLFNLRKSNSKGLTDLELKYLEAVDVPDPTR
jgi:hypothetical protein